MKHSCFEIDTQGHEYSVIMQKAQISLNVNV